MSFNLGFIGGGNMSTAIVKGIIQKGSHPPSKIWVSGPRLRTLEPWMEMGTNVTTDNGELFGHCDMIILGVKPPMLGQAIEDSVKSMDRAAAKSIIFVSMLAGVNMKKLHEAVKVIISKSSIQLKIIRIMPNTPMMVGQGVCIYTPDDTVTLNECKMLEDLLSSSCVCEKVKESLIDSLGVLTACGPAYIYIVIEALADGAVKQGVPRDQALKYAAHMLVGSGQMVLQTGKHPGLLKDEVCSPGGSTICGVSALENGKLRATLINAIEASTLRTKGMDSK